MSDASQLLTSPAVFISACRAYLKEVEGKSGDDRYVRPHALPGVAQLYIAVATWHGRLMASIRDQQVIADCLAGLTAELEMACRLLKVEDGARRLSAFREACLKGAAPLEFANRRESAIAAIRAIGQALLIINYAERAQHGIAKAISSRAAQSGVTTAGSTAPIAGVPGTVKSVSNAPAPLSEEGVEDYLPHAAACAMLRLPKEDPTCKDLSRVMERIRQKAGGKLRTKKGGNKWLYHPGDWMRIVSLVNSRGLHDFIDAEDGQDDPTEIEARIKHARQMKLGNRR